jgi:hypothetical protein
MNLSLKKLKFHEDMSEETPCFSADLYDGGKLIAHVSNRGHGGCNHVIPAKGLTYKDVAHLDNIDTDCDIMGLAEALNFTQKNQAKKFALKKDDKLYTTPLGAGYSFSKLRKTYTAGKYVKCIEGRVKNLKAEGYEVLNTNLCI